jgi:hypothetical protein
MYQEAIHQTVRRRTLDYIYINVKSKLLTKNVIIKVLQIYGTTLTIPVRPVAINPMYLVIKKRQWSARRTNHICKKEKQRNNVSY